MTEARQQFLKASYERVMEDIESAVIRRGEHKAVQLLAASKTMPAEDIVYLSDVGLRYAGENRQQEFTEKYEAVKSAANPAEYHFIGHLQTNKVKYLVGKADLIHSVDSVHLAEEIAKQACRMGVTVPILGQVNIGEEEAKSGVSPDEAPEFFAALHEMQGISLRGMMVVAPICDEKEKIRKYFRDSYRIFIDFFEKKPHNIREAILSMGMSDTYELAIEEGATMVRVGSALFGHRDYGAGR
ncbi:MAG: YggS family pyridoxal phosphate-dependent enzyme [Ruminococcaceae bacterium]|nr:YggS family pyridoxal phosphate-dependent enzyme [Oscillospiraceae bacterium]